MNKNTKQRILSVCLTGATLCGTMANAAAANVADMTDVKQQDWYYTFVKDVMAKDYMVGVAKDQFAPQLKMSRAMFVTAIGRLANIKSGPATTASKFTDVAQTAWYANSVDWAVKNGIVLGVTDKEFNPDGEITREQMCLIMQRFVKYWNSKKGSMIKPNVKEVAFQDAASINAYAREAVFACQNWGLVIGDQNKNFRPQDGSTRAEAAAVLSRLSALLRKDSGSGPSTETLEESYVVKAKLTVPFDVPFDPELASTYDVTADLRNGTIREVDGDKRLTMVAADLVSGDNEQLIKDAIQAALDKAEGQRTVSLGGQTAIVNVEDGKITVQVVVPADKVLKADDEGADEGAVVAFALRAAAPVIDTTGVTQADIEALLEKLQSTEGEQLDITGTDLAAMEKLIEKAEELQGKEADEVQQIVNDYVAEKPELEKFVSGMKPEEIQAAADDYKEQLVSVKEDVLNAEGVEIDEETGAVTIPEGAPVSVAKPAEPVALKVKLDLGAYYDEVMAEYGSDEKKEEYMVKVATELQDRLGLSWNGGLEDAVSALYEINNPMNYVVKNEDGTLSVKDKEAYLALIQDNVAVMDELYLSLNASLYQPEENADLQPVDEAFYQNLIEWAKEKNDGRIVYELTDGAAAMLASESVFVDGEALRGDVTLFHIRGTADAGDYETLLNILLGRDGRVGDLAAKLPTVFPTALNALLGEYELTVTLDATSNN